MSDFIEDVGGNRVGLFVSRAGTHGSRQMAMLLNLTVVDGEMWIVDGSLCEGRSEYHSVQNGSQNGMRTGKMYA